MEEGLGTASFSEALEAARQTYMQSKAVQEEAQNDATNGPSPDEPDEEDDSAPAPDGGEESADAADDLTSGEEEADEAGESDDEDDDQEDDDDEAAEESDAADPDTDPEDAPEDDKKPKPKSRRSQKVEKLQARIESLEQERKDLETNLVERIRAEQQREADARAEAARREQAAAEIERDLASYLGSPQDYERAVEAALEGDLEAGEQVKIWRRNRQVVQKLTMRAEQVVNQRAAEVFWESTKDLPGVDRDLLGRANMGEVLQHLHEAGRGVERDAVAKELAAKDRRIATLEARIKGAQVKKVAKAPTPIETGRPTAPAPKQAQDNPYAKLYDENGRVRPDALEKLRQFGTRALS